MLKLFLSHSDYDSEVAMLIARLLTDLGVNVWIDKICIRPGTCWRDEIQRALKECVAMLLVVSEQALASHNVKEEWQYYHGKQKPIIPLLWGMVDIPYTLYGLQYVDFVKKPFWEAFDDLCAALVSLGIPVAGSSLQRPHSQRAVGESLTLAFKPGAWGEGGRQPQLPHPALPALSRPETLVIPASFPSVADILPPPFDWVDIRDGQTLLLDGRLNREPYLALPRFSIARYPITNAQYQVFVDAHDGYGNEGWWNYSNGARHWRIANSYPIRPSSSDDHPCTGVSWYEAVAFCRWLAFRLGAPQPLAPLISLPTVQQWHWAAVADTGWPYPWGDRFERWVANTLEAGIGRTTPVTRYLHGASRHGVVDMCGNAWEWCLNDWVTGAADIRHEAEQRFIMGGSWHDTRDFACVQHQPCRRPGLRRSTQGFRIAATSAQV